MSIYVIHPKSFCPSLIGRCPRDANSCAEVSWPSGGVMEVFGPCCRYKAQVPETSDFTPQPPTSPVIDICMENLVWWSGRGNKSNAIPVPGVAAAFSKRWIWLERLIWLNVTNTRGTRSSILNLAFLVSSWQWNCSAQSWESTRSQ